MAPAIGIDLQAACGGIWPVSNFSAAARPAISHHGTYAYRSVVGTLGRRVLLHLERFIDQQDAATLETLLIRAPVLGETVSVQPSSAPLTS
jgi:hypothetical protein